MKREWIMNDYGDLCLSGTSLRIARTRIKGSFGLIEPGRRRAIYSSLRLAKLVGETWADERLLSKLLTK